MKVKVISRSADEFTRERSNDLQRGFHNYDRSIRSQEKPVEYVRALNGAKLGKEMDRHIDAVSCMAKNPNHLKWILSGSMDGDIRLWDISSRGPLFSRSPNCVEDGNCYSYDARKLDEAKCIHKDHVSAQDIDYSPTGREFVTGSYDRTGRIFLYNGRHRREIYHTKRMQSYVISGSDDANLRLWKARTSEQLGVVLPRKTEAARLSRSPKESLKAPP